MRSKLKNKIGKIFSCPIFREKFAQKSSNLVNTSTIVRHKPTLRYSLYKGNKTGFQLFQDLWKKFLFFSLSLKKVTGRMQSVSLKVGSTFVAAKPVAKPLETE